MRHDHAEPIAYRRHRFVHPQRDRYYVEYLSRLLPTKIPNYHTCDFLYQLRNMGLLQEHCVASARVGVLRDGRIPEGSRNFLHASLLAVHIPGSAVFNAYLLDIALLRDRHELQEDWQ